MQQNTEKYLFFSFASYGGQDDQIAALEAMIITALSLRRTLVIKEVETASQHRKNEGYRVFDWDLYIDLARTQFIEIMPDGALKEVEFSLRWVHERDFKFKAYHRKQIRYIDGSQLYEPENERYPVLYVLGLKRERMKNSESSMHVKGLFFSVFAQSYCKMKYLLRLYPSQRVNELSDIVLARFGTNRHSCQCLQTLLHSQTRLRRYHFVPNYYMCMHIRACDRALLSERNFLAMQKDQIRYIIETALGRHRNVPIYIMSDIKPDYFDFLKAEYAVYSYRDFPQLKELLSSQSEVTDHNMLYAVEKNIMRHALVKVMPPDRNKLIFETDASYAVPPNVNAVFYSHVQQSGQEWRYIQYLNKIDKMTKLLKNLKKKFKL